jgi:RNA exonuclease 4
MFIKNGTKRSRALKQLAKAELGLEIQDGSHSSVDDARAALYLYHKHRKAWERALTQPQGLRKLGYGARAMGAGSKTAKNKMAAAAARDVRLDPLADL